MQGGKVLRDSPTLRRVSNLSAAHSRGPRSKRPRARSVELNQIIHETAVSRAPSPPPPNTHTSKYTHIHAGPPKGSTPGTQFREGRAKGHFTSTPSRALSRDLAVLRERVSGWHCTGISVFGTGLAQIGL